MLGTYRPIRIWFKIQQKLSTAKENDSKKLAMKKKQNFELNFSPLKQNFFELFLLFLIANCRKFKMKKEKKSKMLFLHSKNGGEILIGYTFRVGYT